MTEIFTRDEAKAADKDLYDAMINVARKEALISGHLNSIHYAVNDEYRRKYDSRSGWKLTDVEVQDKLVEMIETTQYPFRAEEYRGKLNRLAQAVAEHAQAVEARNAADKWADHGQWNRFSVVPGGHIHTDLRCFTFRLTTDVRWAYPVSGDSVDEAIAVYGEALCTHCFPNAPVAQTTGKVEVDADGHPISKAEAQAARDARAAEKAARAAEKAARAEKRAKKALAV
jgi:hypothetical protein